MRIYVKPDMNALTNAHHKLKSNSIPHTISICSGQKYGTFGVVDIYTDTLNASIILRECGVEESRKENK